MWFGLGYSGLDTYLFRGKAPWTFAIHPDHEELEERMPIPGSTIPSRTASSPSTGFPPSSWGA
jgi:electron-transferring-flavoprotein dehydrogenase